MDGSPIDPEKLLEKMLGRQNDMKVLREEILDAVKTGRYEKGQALAMLYCGDMIQDLTMTLMIPQVNFETKATGPTELKLHVPDVSDEELARRVAKIAPARTDRFED